MTLYWLALVPFLAIVALLCVSMFDNPKGNPDA